MAGPLSEGTSWCLGGGHDHPRQQSEQESLEWKDPCHGLHHLSEEGQGQEWLGRQELQHHRPLQGIKRYSIPFQHSASKHQVYQVYFAGEKYLMMKNQWTGKFYIAKVARFHRIREMLVFRAVCKNGKDLWRRVRFLVFFSQSILSNSRKARNCGII